MGGVTRLKSNNTCYPLFLDSSHVPFREASTRPNRCVALRSVNSQPWHFTNNSLGLPHAHSLSVCLFACLPVCLFESVSCVYAFFSPCLSTCVPCAACFFALFYIHHHLFVFFLLFLQNSIDTYVTVPIDIHIVLLMHPRMEKSHCRRALV